MRRQSVYAVTIPVISGSAIGTILVVAGLVTPPPPSLEGSLDHRQTHGDTELKRSHFNIIQQRTFCQKGKFGISIRHFGKNLTSIFLTSIDPSFDLNGK